MKKLIFAITCFLAVNTSHAQDSLAYNIATNAYGNRKFDDAIYWFTKSIEKKYRVADCYLYRGASKMYLQNSDEARTDMFYSYKLDSLKSMTSYMLGTFYYDKGDLDSSIIWFGKAISIDPKDPDFRSNRAAAYLDKNESEKALTDINLAISLSPDNAKFLYLRGYIKQNQPDLEGALADYNAVLKIDPSMENNYFSYIGISYCHFNLGESDRGLSEVTDVLTRYPKIAYALLVRGQMYKGLGDKEKACADAMTLKSVDPVMAKDYFESYCE